MIAADVAGEKKAQRLCCALKSEALTCCAAQTGSASKRLPKGWLIKGF
jgi:hypothetical protein